MELNHNHFAVAVNGRLLQVPAREAFSTLAVFLRRQQGLTGLKVVCAEGDCGACSVLMYQVDGNGIGVWLAVNSCITLMHQMAFRSLITVEGLRHFWGEDPFKIMANAHGAQCGFCTPGFMMAIAAHVDQKAGKPSTVDEIKTSLTGNLCRCTGYTSIIEGACALSSTEKPSLSAIAVADSQESGKVLTLAEQAQDLWQKRRPLRLAYGACEVVLPSTFADALEERAQDPNSLVMNGATDLGVLINKGRLEVKRVIGLSLLPELGYLRTEASGARLSVGATTSLSQLEHWAKHHAGELYRLLLLFASPQIKNRGTLVGNIATGSPIGDTLPLLLVAQAELVVCRKGGERVVSLENFYKGYKTFDLRPDELIKEVRFDLPQKTDRLFCYKVSRRRHLDISACTAAFWRHKDGCRVAFGGMGPYAQRVKPLEDLFQGQKLNGQLKAKAEQILDQEFQPISDVRGQAIYRRQVARGLLSRLFHDLGKEVQP